jgi:hypothetical protein
MEKTLGDSFLGNLEAALLLLLVARRKSRVNAER